MLCLEVQQRETKTPTIISVSNEVVMEKPIRDFLESTFGGRKIKIQKFCKTFLFSLLSAGSSIPVFLAYVR